MNYLSVALGGAIGASLRYLISGWLQAASTTGFPVGTLAVNVLGSLIIGLVLQLGVDRYLLSVQTRLLLTTGFCGGFTTFSTFSYETLRLMEDQQWVSATGNIVLNVVVCLVAVYAGTMIARAM